MRCLIRLSLVSLVLGVGCQSDHFELRLTPKDGKLERELTAYRINSAQDRRIEPLDEQELARIAKEYGQPAPGGEGPKRTFAGVFARRMPQDVGGYGTFVEWPSEFGVARVYLERFRGDDDLVAALDRQRKAIDRLCDLLVGWIDVAWADQPEHAAMRRFTDRDLRHDLLNLSYYLKASELLRPANESQKATAKSDLNRQEFDGAARILQYLVERQYVDVDQVPQLVRNVMEAHQDEKYQEFLQILVAIVRRKIGVPDDQPLPPSLALLTDVDRVRQSLNDTFRNCEEYRVKLAEWSETPLADRSNDPPEPVDVISDLLGAGFESLVIGLFGQPHQLSVTMSATVQPTSTNGRWDADKRTITWSRAITDQVEQGSSRHRLLPTLLYAGWAEPAEAEQVRRLGAVVMREELLWQFCIWRIGLKPDEERQWKKFVDTIQPGERLVEQFEKFRFEGEPEEVHESQRSAVLLQIMREVLKPKEE